MIAIVTSTLIPTRFYSVFSPVERLSQTINTIEKLQGAGFSQIWLFDNSLSNAGVKELAKACPKVQIHHTPQYTFKNKGLNEALLLLNNIHHLPANTPIFKISGRYYPSAEFKKDIYDAYVGKDFVGVGYNFKNKIADFSTKAYFVKNAEVLTSTVVSSVEDMISYAKGIHGIKSGLTAVKEIFEPKPGTPYQLSIEQSFARILKQNNNYQLLDKMHIEGAEASASTPTPFSE